MKKRILFLVAEIGLAHLTESLAIAEELAGRGHGVVYALPKRKRGLVKGRKTGIKFVDVNPLLESDSVEIVKLIKDDDYVDEKIKEDIELLKKVRPDYVVIDYRPSAVVACACMNIPVAYVTVSAGLPGSCCVPNPKLPKWLFDFMSPLLNRIAKHFMDKMIMVAVRAAGRVGLDINQEKLVERMDYIVPENEGYLPKNDRLLKAIYVGPIFWKGFEAKTPNWLRKIKPDGRTVYLTFGGTGFDPDKLMALTEKLLKAGYRVVVSCSDLVDLERFPRHKNLRVARYLPGLEVCRRVDVVVCHGGHGSVMQAVTAGKPVVTIPFNPDQLLHSLRAQELGYGICMWRLTGRQMVKLAGFDWDYFEQIGKRVRESDVVGAVGQVLGESSFREKAEEYGEKLKKLDGARLAADVVDR